MKTTIDLPKDLVEIVETAAKNSKTTFPAIVERALRREVALSSEEKGGEEWEVNDFGFPVLGQENDVVVTSENVYQLIDDLGI